MITTAERAMCACKHGFLVDRQRTGSPWMLGTLIWSQYLALYSTGSRKTEKWGIFLFLRNRLLFIEHRISWTPVLDANAGSGLVFHRLSSHPALYRGAGGCSGVQEPFECHTEGGVNPVCWQPHMLMTDLSVTQHSLPKLPGSRQPHVICLKQNEKPNRNQN